MKHDDVDICIIGAGATGLSAAIECAERGAQVVCLEQSGMPGGLMANVGRIDGMAAIPQSSGASLAERLSERCHELGVRMVQTEVRTVERRGAGYVLTTDDGSFASPIVLAASGARLKQLGVQGEAEFAGRGVSQCDWCDGGFFRNEDVLVIGGGDAAFQAALHLASICASVTLVIRSAAIRARRAYVLAAADNPRISFLWETAVEAIEGDGKVQRVRLRDLVEDRVFEQAAQGVFVFVGLAPNTAFLPEDLQRDADGRLVTGPDFQTSSTGLFAAGAVRSGYRGQLVSACGEGASAGAAAIEALEALAL